MKTILNYLSSPGRGGSRFSSGPQDERWVKSETILAQCVPAPKKNRGPHRGALARRMGGAPTTLGAAVAIIERERAAVPRPGELTSSQIGRLLGTDPLVRSTLHQVEHQDCDYGTHWKWNGRDTVYNPWGVLRIVRGLSRRGFVHQASLVASAAGLSSPRSRKKFWWENL